jgi:hypothetical protein
MVTASTAASTVGATTVADTARKRARLQGYYFSQDFQIKNLGDALGAVVVGALGYQLVASGEEQGNQQDGDVENPSRCLIPIGSTLDTSFIKPMVQKHHQMLDFWGCGWRGNWLDESMLQHVEIHAVRGPLTHRRFELGPEIPMGDPGLLVPWLCELEPNDHGRAVVIPHFRRTYSLSAAERCRRTGCDMLIPTQVRFDDRPYVRRKLRGRVETLYGQTVLAIGCPTLMEAVSQIAGASFVLTGSLHGAILAQAFGVPWAAYYDGYVDTLPKWYDWAAYLGVELDFVRDRAEGEKWWAKYGRHATIRDLRPLLEAFPHPIQSEVGQRVLGQQQPVTSYYQ